MEQLSGCTLSRVFLIVLALAISPTAPVFAKAPITQERSPAGTTFSPATNDLFIAVRRKDLKAVEAAIKAGADIYATNRKGTSAVGLAVDQGFFEIAHFLLRLRGERDKRITQSDPNSKGAWAPKVTLAEPKPLDKDLKPSQVAINSPPPLETPVLADDLVVPLPPRRDVDQSIALASPSEAAKPTAQRPFALDPPKEEVPALPPELAEVPAIPSEATEPSIRTGLPKIDLPNLTDELPDAPNSPEKDDFSIPSIGETLAPEPPASTNPTKLNTAKVESPVVPAPNRSNVESEVNDFSVEEVKATDVDKTQQPPTQNREITASSSNTLIKKLRTSFSQLTSDLVAGTDASDRKRTSRLVNKFEESFEQFAERYVRERGPSGTNEPGAAGRLVSEVKDAYLRLIQRTTATVVTREDAPAKLPNLTETIQPEFESEPIITEVQKEIASPAPSTPVTNTQTTDTTPEASSSNSPIALSRQSALEKMRAKILNTWRFISGSSAPEEKQAPQQAPVEFVQKRNPVRTPITSPPITAQTPSDLPETEDEATFVEDPGSNFEETPAGSLPGLPELPEIGELNGTGAIAEVPATTPKGTDELALLPPPEGYEHLAKPGETENGGEANAQASAISNGSYA